MSFSFIATASVAVIEGIAVPWHWLQTNTVGPDDPGSAAGIWAWAGYNGFMTPAATWD